jgi:hypothetical protein
MSSKNLSARFAVLALVVGAGSASAYGCSSSNSSNPAPSTHDSGTDVTTNDGSGSSSGGGGNDGSMNDVVVIDTGSCMSDASTCNSCYTTMEAQEDPLNACAPETANCIPFTQTVPTHPML